MTGRFKNRRGVVRAAERAAEKAEAGKAREGKRQYSGVILAQMKAQAQKPPPESLESEDLP